MTGDVFINGYDAYTRYGINLEDGALSMLMTPPPSKGYVENESRLEHGKRVIIKNQRYSERELTLPFHIIALSRTDFFNKYERFCSEVLSQGKITINTKYQTGVYYNLVYVSCSQFRQFQQQTAVFSLKVTEPNPNDRVMHL